ncbi:hypothetical protein YASMINEVIRUS_1484 [Yasminevirus sp. GU-2018]|uniref:Phospholipid/glycerol acyltransferase domain-containing protein n=1 Tax=Yasminevirus sp. GU-2018 TaxID=2420051 RepID=A0A5K0UBD6_9VIRU|nr:hypothetical protein YASMINEVIRUS_1484 [Yasminevirus sp. GU-2018]
MNIGYFIVLFAFVVIFQIPCFILSLIAYPTRTLFKNRYFTHIAVHYLMRGAYWANKVFFRMKIINDRTIDQNKKYVRMGNHSSFVDAIIISEINHPSMTIAINYSKYFQLLGWNLALIGIPFVGDKGGKGITQMYTDFLNDDDNKELVLSLFPTGSRIFIEDDLKLEELKSGGFVIAKNLGLEIVPMYHNIIDSFHDVKKEYNPTAELFCVHGAPIKTEGREIDQIKQEYHESMLKLREQVRSLKNRSI